LATSAYDVILFLILL